MNSISVIFRHMNLRERQSKITVVAWEYKTTPFFEKRIYRVKRPNLANTNMEVDFCSLKYGFTLWKD